MTTPVIKHAELLAVPFASIPAEPVMPLWPGWIARRNVTLVVAPGGTSKGLWAVDVISRVTTGRPWPGEPEEATRKPEAVILVAPEDDPNEAVAWRLAAAGADTSLVFNLTVLPDGSPFTLPDSIADLRAAMAQVAQVTGHEVGLVVIDPLMATVEHSIASNIQARRVTAPLLRLAKETGAAVILTHHTVKSGSTAGSKGLTDAMRHVIRIGRPDKTSNMREVTVEKSNMGSASARLSYEVLEHGTFTRVEYPADKASGVAGARGYTISAHMAVPHQLLLAAEGDPKPAKIGTYPDEQAAKDAAKEHGGHPMAWLPGEGGSQYAMSTPSKGKQVAYTIFPENSAGGVDSSKP